MRPLAALGAEEARRVRGVFFDLDDTLLSHGVLTRAAYGALWDLHDAGLALAAVTGRPAAWGELAVRQWPIDAAVTETGAVTIVRGPKGPERRDGCDAAERGRRRARLAALVEDVRVRLPDAKLTDDAAQRVSDVTWDIGERETLPEDRVRALLAAIAEAGARSSRSTVHVHATFDAADKAAGAVRWAASRGEDAGAALATWAFVGDSPNDSTCFGAFQLTFGVANVRRWVPHLAVPPRWVARGAMGEGFAEIARRLLELR